MQVENDRVVYLMASENGVETDIAFSLPHKNMAFLLLGKGTSITNAAIRKLAEQNVVV